MLGRGEDFRQIGIVDHLDQAAAVAQVDKDDATVVATAIHPAAEFNGLVDMGGVDFTAIMAAHGVFPDSKRRGAPTRGAPQVRLICVSDDISCRLEQAPVPQL